jgi:uncharacterized membrane protein
MDTGWHFKQLITSSKPTIMRVVIIPLLFLFVTGMFVSGCYYDKADLLYGTSAPINCAATSAKFATDVNPIIQSKCATSGCHNSASAAGNCVLVTYAQISAQSARINQRCVVEKTMPTGGPLPAAEMAILKCWIDSGSPNN